MHAITLPCLVMGVLVVPPWPQSEWHNGASRHSPTHACCQKLLWQPAATGRWRRRYLSSRFVVDDRILAVTLITSNL